MKSLVFKSNSLIVSRRVFFRSLKEFGKIVNGLRVTDVPILILVFQSMLKSLTCFYIEYLFKYIYECFHSRERRSDLLEVTWYISFSIRVPSGDVAFLKSLFLRSGRFTRLISLSKFGKMPCCIEKRPFVRSLAGFGPQMTTGRTKGRGL